MGCTNKGFSLLLVVILVVSSLMMTKPASEYPLVNAQLFDYLYMYFDNPSNQTYYTSNITLTVHLTIAIYDSRTMETVASYSLDGQDSITLPLVKSFIENNPISFAHSDDIGTINLSNLSDGSHAIVVNGRFDHFTNSVNTTFFINTHAMSSPSPTPTVPELQTWMILPLFTVIILLSIVFFRNRIPKKWA
jgi:hypothetical protein